MLVQTLNEVEDELTDIPYQPEAWATDGRLYPPLMDHRTSVPGNPEVFRLRSRKHYTFIRTNGAMCIVTLSETVVFDAPGADGKGVWS